LNGIRLLNAGRATCGCTRECRMCSVRCGKVACSEKRARSTRRPHDSLFASSHPHSFVSSLSLSLSLADGGAILCTLWSFQCKFCDASSWAHRVVY
jgi:hypothetical protein